MKRLLKTIGRFAGRFSLNIKHSDFFGIGWYLGFVEHIHSLGSPPETMICFECSFDFLYWQLSFEIML